MVQPTPNTEQAPLGALSLASAPAIPAQGVDAPTKPLARSSRI